MNKAIIWPVLLLIHCSTNRMVVVPVLLDYKVCYPAEARKMGLEGVVTVKVLVGKNGRAEEVFIYESAGNYLLDSAAVHSARTFIFSPAIQGKQPVKAWVIVPLEFRIGSINLEEWVIEVKSLLKRIKDPKKDTEEIEQLYELYKQFIYSSLENSIEEANYYVKEVVMEPIAEIWKGFWTRYPARVLLFLDIMERFSDTFTALVVRADFNEFFKDEKLDMERSLHEEEANLLIRRIVETLQSLDIP
ncbi:hypothetical protein BXT86_01190 [candidate division WOR-3 bacterium 4484_100]|uniref:TonB C-terminal domain-containing protein n=1 Tax=candidate division WOR-3 bacterium 4484_100 TaxID=1936077 RepID=A0A1V4QGS1_UNCW3|nr:MAG: hypothetical protein BXT86_01190 [candidate division WOR-3 bacterium 4484_100]